MVDTLEVRCERAGAPSDAQGRVSQQTQADGGIWRFAYTAPAGFITETTVTDPRGNSTTYRFNSFGYLSSQTDALGQTTTFERANGTNLLLSTTDPLGRVTRFAYDTNGNVTSITDPAGNVRTFTYEPTFNRLTSITDPLGNLTTFEYDAQGNLVTVTDPEQNLKPPAERLKTQIAYNQFGQPISTTDPLGNVTTFTYDAQGNLITIADPLGNTTTRTYDLVSRLIAQTDPRGKTTRFGYDNLNRLTQIVDALNGVTAFNYDPNGNLLGVTDARGSSTLLTYSVMDRITTRTDPLNRIESFAYDLNGNLVQYSDRKGQTSIFTYDRLNRLSRSNFADGSFTEFSYDAVGGLIQISDSVTGNTLEEYDLLNRLIRETTPQGTITYAYDAAGRRTTLTVDGQSPVSYAYDTASRLRAITQPPLNATTIDYDAAGRRTLLTLPNGVSTEYQYNAASQLAALIYRGPTGFLGDLTYTYDQAGNTIGLGGSFARTLLPNSVVSAVYDAANQQLSFADKTMNFDANGNVSTIADAAGVTTFTWDARNRLIDVSTPNLTASFVYDPFGRRVRKTVNGQSSSFRYDGLDIVAAEQNGGVSRFLRTMQIDEPLARLDADTKVHFLADALGSTVSLTGENGAIITDYTYAPFGQTARSGFSDRNTFQFTSREQDETGLYYFRARYLHPLLGRFISEDPIGPTGGSLNLYAYVFNSPTVLTDPTGEEPVTLAVITVIAAAAWGAVANEVATIVRSGGVDRADPAKVRDAGIRGAIGTGVGTAVTFASGNPVAGATLGGAAGGLADNLVGQVQRGRNLSNLSPGEAALATALGAGTGRLTAAIIPTGISGRELTLHSIRKTVDLSTRQTRTGAILRVGRFATTEDIARSAVQQATFGVVLGNTIDWALEGTLGGRK